MHSTSTASGPDTSGGHQDDLRLVQAALAGEAGALDTLLDRLLCVRRFLAFKNRRFGGVLDASGLEDTIQDALFAIWRKLDQYAGHGSLEAWVYRFAYLEFIAHLRKRRGSPRPIEAAEQIDVASPRESRFGDHERLYRALETLGPPSGPVIRLKHLEALTFDEIGQALSVPVATVKTQYYRGMELLRQMLGPFEVELRRTE